MTEMITKNQSYGYNQKAFFELISCLIKLYFKIIFCIVSAIKYGEKSPLGWKHLSYVKDWKINKLSFSDELFCHKIAFGTILNQAICHKDQIWCKITFLHENATFMETFAMGFINKLEFWDSTAGDDNLFRNRPLN